MLAREKEPEENKIMRVLKDSYRLYAANRYGSGQRIQELENQAESKDAQAILNDITAVIISTQSAFLLSEQKLMREGHNFSWGGLYEFCAENKVAYQGVPLDFKWRNFRKKTKGLFKEQKMIFLRGNFTVYKLKDDDVAHQSALWTMKACAKAQGVWRSEAGKAEPGAWKLWDAEVTKEYKSLSGGKARNVSLWEN